MSDTALFTPYSLGPLMLANRIVMAPLTRNRAGKGLVPSDLAVTYYAQRASAGLLITEATQISADAQGYQDTPGIYTPAQVAGWRAVADAVHAVHHMTLRGKNNGKTQICGLNESRVVDHRSARRSIVVAEPKRLIEFPNRAQGDVNARKVLGQRDKTINVPRHESAFRRTEVILLSHG